MNLTNDAIRMRAREAAAFLGLDRMYVYQLVADGVFTALRPSGKGPGQRLWLYTDEVKLFATGGKDAVIKFRKKHRRM